MPPSQDCARLRADSPANCLNHLSGPANDQSNSGSPLKSVRCIPCYDFANLLFLHQLESTHRINAWRLGQLIVAIL